MDKNETCFIMKKIIFKSIIINAQSANVSKGFTHWWTRNKKNDIHFVFSGPQLMTMKRYVSAAQLFIAGDQIKEAIDAFIAAKEWAKAEKVAQELDPRLESCI